jgi:putative CocE/NonD family hydrolase
MLPSSGKGKGILSMETMAGRIPKLLVVLALLVAALVIAPTKAHGAPNNYVTLPDGTQIAVNVRLPDNYVAGSKYPTLFEMSGYDGGSAQGGTLLNDFGLQDVPVLPASDSRQITERFNGQYVTIHASVRGTGCSSGEFDLFSGQSAEDGKYIIDQWIPNQSWSNGNVAYIGHSYGGITGFRIAETQPAHLRAISVSGLIDDMYRGITYPGGVANYGFPLAWAGGIRLAYDLLGGTAPGILRDETDQEVEDRRIRCANNQLEKRRTILDDPIIQGLTDTDSEWMRARSLITLVDRINVPIHITGAYQDEQTGPRGPTHLWEQVRGVPKRLILTNGDHNTQNPAYASVEVWGDRKAWIDHFMGVTAHTEFGSVTADRTSVRMLLETHRDAAGALISNGKIDSTTFPFPTTTWKNYYLRGNRGLSTAPPSLFDAASDVYLSGSRREAWSYQAGPAFGPPFTTLDGPDEVAYRTEPMTTNTLLAGPITANLFVSATSIDTELFVQLIDEAPDGARTYLQRGMLRASHRAIDPSRSDYAGSVLYRPYRPHTTAQLLTPGAVYEYLVEVFPVGHVFRPGHRLLVKISAPPILDSFYAYVPKTTPGINTVFHTPAQPSRLVLPLVPLAGAGLGPALACGAQEAVRCIAAPNG